MYWRDCKECGKLCSIPNKNRLYCSEKCKSIASYKRKSVKYVKVISSFNKECKWCDKPFTTIYSTALYCNKRCKEMNKRNTLEYKAKERARSNFRRAKRMNACVKLSEQEKKQIKAIYELAQTLTCTKNEQYEVHHILPISKGGLHHPDNLTVLSKKDHIELHKALDK